MVDIPRKAWCQLLSSDWHRYRDHRMYLRPQVGLTGRLHRSDQWQWQSVLGSWPHICQHVPLTNYLEPLQIIWGCFRILSIISKETLFIQNSFRSYNNQNIVQNNCRKERNKIIREWYLCLLCVCYVGVMWLLCWCWVVAMWFLYGCYVFAMKLLCVVMGLLGCY